MEGPVGISLHDAAREGSAQTILMRLAMDAEINAPDAEGLTPLYLAVKEGHLEAAKLLLDCGANVEAPSGPLLVRPIHAAAMSLNPEMMKTVLKYRPNLETRVSGLTPLFYAVTTGDVEVVRLLLGAGADIQARTPLGETVLFMAVGSWKNSLLPLLLEHGADVTATTTKPAGQTAVHFASQFGNGEAIRQLIAAGADPFATLADGRNALHIAATHGHVTAASALLDHGLDILLEHQHGMSAVHMAALHNKKKMFWFLLEKCAASMSKAAKIHLGIVSASAGHRDLLEALVGKGFPVLVQNDRGDTALSLSAYTGQKDVLIFLLRHGADPLQQNREGLTSLDMARLGQHQDIVQLLQEAVSQLGISPSAELFPNHKYAQPQVSAAEQAETLAATFSLQATRQICANPEPPGTFTCNYCKSLDFRRGQPPEAEVVFFMSLAGIRLYASKGCKGCRFLSDCLTRALEMYGTNLWSVQPEAHFVLHSPADGAPLLLYMQAHNPTFFPPRRIEIFVKEGSGATWPVVGFGRDVSSPGWSQERVTIARHMIQDCIAKHKDCSHRTGPLPTRVIRVGSRKEDPRLYVSNGEHAPYITLSHCWGSSSPITTTTNTLSQRLDGIPLSSLPRTFRDAVEITRSLGINYLWIDSLCIIQDDDEDWRREAAKMKDVYANCHVMIAVDDSPNPQGGCFPSAPEATRCHEVKSLGPWMSKVTAFVRLTHLRDPFHMEICHRIGKSTSSSTESSRGVLNGRGWCLQERVLAPRILHFGQSEFGWECPTTVACECQATTTALDRESRFKALLADRILRDAPLDKADPDTPVLDILLWMNVVGEFTRRQLTYNTDMLHALSGLASCMAAATGSRYLCGLWDHELPEFLMWKVDYEMGSTVAGGVLAARPFQAQQSTRGFNNVVRPKRYESTIPSWSWASVVAPIAFRVGRLDTSRKDQISHVRKDGQLERSKNRVSMLDSVAFDIEVDPLNEFGPPRRAVMKITGLMADVTWAEKEKSWDARISQSQNGGLLVYRGLDDDRLPAIENLTLEDTQRKKELSRLTADFEPDVRDEDLEVSLGDSLVLLFVLRDLEAIVGKEYEIKGSESSQKVVSGFPGVMLEGLVLVRVETGDAICSEVYRRIGIFTTTDEGWGEILSRRTISIV